MTPSAMSHRPPSGVDDTSGALVGGQDGHGEDAQGEGEDGDTEVVQPAKIVRVATMVSQLLEELRDATLDEASLSRLQRIQEAAMAELEGAFGSDLAQELSRMAPAFGAKRPSRSEIRIAQAQLVGWLEGLFNSFQAAQVARQIEARLTNEGSGPSAVTTPAGRHMTTGSESSAGRGVYL